MSIRIMSDVWSISTIKHVEKLVLLALADNANDTGVCWPSLNTIASKCSLSRQGVLNQIAKLEGDGLLRTIRENGKSNRYQIVTSPVNGVDQSTQLTRPQHLPYQSTPLTTPVNGVDPNHKEPSREPPVVATRKKSRKSEPITDEYLGELQESYPWVRIRQEFTKALTWCEANPGRICSRKFFVGWINRVPAPPSASVYRKPEMRLKL